MQVAPVLLALALALAVPSSSAERKCILIGTWVNGLGSNMTINAVNSKGEFDGSYISSVADKPNEIEVSPLQGFQHINKEQPTFSFTVNWTFSDSTSVFVDRCFVDKHGQEILKTMWLLRDEVENPGQDWKATSPEMP
ncbi:PREDICTED: avidin-related protein 4/5-like [Tinamus guttatus]|uniref:avidin-related protein 4/5-like n=1 Tax=Tinamus guttatus TaxID=94827 RepID=UPI00052E791C|nr:PREDICTED: avidin-related protein 4/5-like [Tinamus guttatus]